MADSYASIKKVLRNTGKDCRFSLIIPTWNNLPYLKLCIESIRKNSSFPHQIIVHVNEGKDGTLEWVESQADLDYTYSEKNIGICYALNFCRTIVKTDYFVYINDDMYVCPDWDKELSSEVEKVGHPYFFLSSTAIEPIASSNCVIEKDFGRDLETFDEGRLLKEFRQLEKGDWMGSTWPPNIVHVDTWDLIGGYSVEYSPGMYSDPDFSMKLYQAGVRLFKGVSASRAYHFGSKSTKRVVKNKGYYMFISKWKMTSRTFTQLFLKRGEPFTGPVGEAVLPVSLKFKSYFKRLVSLFK